MKKSRILIITAIIVAGAGTATGIGAFSLSKNESYKISPDSQEAYLQTTTSRELYTKEELLDELLGVEPVDVKEENGVQIETFPNGAVARIKGDKVTVTIGDQEFDFSYSQYRTAIPEKPTEPPETEATYVAVTTAAETTTTAETTTAHTHEWEEITHTEKYVDHTKDFEETIETKEYDLVRDGEVIGTYKTEEEAKEKQEKGDEIKERVVSTKKQTNHDGDVEKTRKIVDYYRCKTCGEIKR